MIKITQRFPNSFSGFTSEDYTFNSWEDVDDFINNPPKGCFIHRWKSSDDFVKFEMARHYKSQKVLLVHLKESYWGIAFVEEFND